jgi:hypothetical protein
LPAELIGANKRCWQQELWCVSVASGAYRGQQALLATLKHHSSAPQAVSKSSIACLDLALVRRCGASCGADGRCTAPAPESCGRLKPPPFNGVNDVLPPLLGAAKAQLGASSSRRRQWVESEPCGQLELCLGIFPLPPAGVSLPPARVSLALKPSKWAMVDLQYFPYENHQFALVTQS